MSTNKGFLVEYTDAKGMVQKGILNPKEQAPVLAKVNKYIVRLVDDKFNPKVDDNGKKLVALKHFKDMDIVGFID